MPSASVWSSGILATGADVTTVPTAVYDSVVNGCGAVVDTDGAGLESAASESLPAHTPAAITAASTAPAAPTGTHLAASFSVFREPDERELDEREPDGRELELR